MFTTGRIIFTLAFLLVFVAGLAWSYRKERSLNQTHYKKAYLVLLGILLFITLLYLIVKLH
jgi:cbb3-type cytochrome oxidase subunit 3